MDYLAKLRRASRPVRREFDILYKDLEGLLARKVLDIDKIDVKFQMFIDILEVLRKHDDQVMEQLGHEEVSESEEDEVKDVHYVPHRPVIKESLTTPIRPVFDASCRDGKAPSLNDCLYTGEIYIKKILELIWRFREKSLGFVADIRKAFQMIGMPKEDRDRMRFLWWTGPDMKTVMVYRHARLMFGATCSPFVLTVVIYYHLSNLPEEKKEMGKKLLSTLYVDNCVYSEDTENEYQDFRKQATELMKEAGMDLRLWLSSVDEFENEDTHTISVLGLRWDRKEDELYVNLKAVSTPEKVTKRTVLSAIQKIYDPIGFLSPALLPMKLILQELWQRKIKWDTELPERENQIFKNWIQEVGELEQIRIPRWVTGENKKSHNWSLHTFCDASKGAYAAVVYLRVEKEDGIRVQLVAAKARVAPIKPLGIPRLELMACVVGVRLTESLKTALQWNEVEQNFWSDSVTALAWIRRDDQWGTFVANRTREIRKTSAAESWRHVAGIDNPADLPSRGCNPGQLLKSRWWEGPDWLRRSKDAWPVSNQVADEKDILIERKKATVAVSACTVMDEVKKSHSFSGLVRIIGWVRRFLFNYLKKKTNTRKQGPLTREELGKAEKMFIKSIQTDAFPKENRNRLAGLEVLVDDWGLLRVKTRLTYRNDPENFKYPVILPHEKEEVRALIRETHRSYCHGGVGFLMCKLRSKYWITKARRTIKSVLSKCERCRRFNAKPSIPAPAPLPFDRVTTAEVMDVIGTDMTGPLIMRNGKKVWLVIFTCAVYRAVHFKLVKTLSTNGFLGALQKFCEKYHRPKVIYADNGTNFRGTDNMFKLIDWDKLQENEEVSRIIFKFNPAASSWYGGFFERMIRTAKDLLRRTVGKGSLSFNELKTVIGSVADVMNARPLTYVSVDPNDLEPLTPAMFLRPYGSCSFPEQDAVRAQHLRRRYNYITTLRKELKERFLREYLSSLVNRYVKKESRGLTVGELVLVGCDNIKRVDWPLGKILELIPGSDGKERMARVKIEKGEIVRPFQKLYPLEMNEGTKTENAVRERAVKTRSGKPGKFQLPKV